MAANVAVGVLGTLDVRHDGEVVTVTAPRQRALLAYLALRAGLPASTEEIIDALWHEPPDGAVNVVQQYVAALRRVLGRDAIVTSGRTYRLAADRKSVDWARFHDSVQGARRGSGQRAPELLTAALQCWRGAALADLPDCPFVEPARTSMEAERDATHLALLGWLVDNGRAEEALPDLHHLAVDRPLDEGVAALLVGALAVAGRQADALGVYDATRLRLADELGLDPGPALRAAQTAVLEQRLPALLPQGTRPPPARLPHARTSMIGRDHEVAAILELLEAAMLPVTVTGTGGVGKTRVALAVADRAAAFRPVIFVELAALADSTQVLPTVAAAAGLKVDGPSA